MFAPSFEEENPEAAPGYGGTCSGRSGVTYKDLRGAVSHCPAENLLLRESFKFELERQTRFDVEAADAARTDPF